MYLESLQMAVCDRNCFTLGCQPGNIQPAPYQWGPHCECINSNYRRLSNGTCVLFNDPQCAAEYQPSTTGYNMRNVWETNKT